jgi:hypothetical protein
MSVEETAAPAAGVATDASARVVGALCRALSTWRLYPNAANQPAFAAAIKAIGQEATHGPLHIRVSRDRFASPSGTFGDDNETSRSLAAALYERDVIELHIRSAPEPSELAAFAEMVNEEPSVIEGEGGANSYLELRGVAAIGVTTRDLAVTGHEVLAPTPKLPDTLRSLLQDEKGLAARIEGEFEPGKGLDYLEGLLQEGLLLDVGGEDLYSRIGDTVASFSEDYRADVIELSVQSLPAGFGTAITSQLSDGELSEVLTSLARTRGLDVAIAYARKVVEHSPGRRDELPLVVGKNLIANGFDKDLVLHAFGTSRLLEKKSADASFKIEGMSLAAVEEPDLEQLRAEASFPGGQVDRAVGLATFKALLTAELGDDEFQGLAEFGEQAIRSGVKEGDPRRSLALLEAMIEASEGQPDGSPRRERLEEAARSAVSAELVSDLLSPVSPEMEDPSRRLLAILREKSIPALLERLAQEPDRSKRKVLVEMLTDVAYMDVQVFLTALNDKRWYFVRNVVTVLAKAGVHETARHIEPLLRHNDPRVRREAVRAVAMISGTEAVPKVRSCLSDVDEGVRLAAIAALGMVRESEATRYLMEVVRKTKGHSIRERKEALSSLSLHATSEAARFIEDTARRRWPPSEATKQLSRRAGELLARSR